MTLDELQEDWSKDSVIDKSELENESLNTTRLHAKYWIYLCREQLILDNARGELAILRLGKRDFYLYGHTEETKKAGWILPARGANPVKAEIPDYLAADPDIIKATHKISYQNEKVSFLESVIKMILGRNYIISNAITIRKYEGGVG